MEFEFGLDLKIFKFQSFFFNKYSYVNIMYFGTKEVMNVEQKLMLWFSFDFLILYKMLFKFSISIFVGCNELGSQTMQFYFWGEKQKHHLHLWSNVGQVVKGLLILHWIGASAKLHIQDCDVSSNFNNKKMHLTMSNLNM